MKIQFTLFLLSLLPIISFGQNSDSLKNEILSYVDENIELIEKGRGLLHQNFTQRNLTKVKEIKDYLLLKAQNSYVAFSDLELIYIMYWTKEYETLIEEIQKTHPVINSYQYPYEEDSFVQYDLLSETLENESYKYLDELVNAIKESENSSIKKDFLILYLKSSFIQIYEENPIINDLADQFITQYPNSKYEGFIRKNIRFKTSPSDWAFAYELFAGYGIHKKGIADNLRNSIPIGFNLDAEFYKIIMNGRITFGVSKTLKEIEKNQVKWKKGSSATIIAPELSIGYLYENKSFKIYPFTGFSWTSIEPSEDDTTEFPELKDFKIGGVIAYNFGLNLDIKLKGLDLNRYYSNNIEYSFIRFRYNYSMPQFEADLSGFAGNIHNITIGFGQNSRWIKRDF